MPRTFEALAGAFLAAGVLLAPGLAFALVPADLCTGDPCVITGSHSTTDPFTVLDFGTADVFLDGTLDVGSNSVDILAGSFAIRASGKLLAQSTTSAADGGDISVLTSGDIQLTTTNSNGAIIASGCSGGSVDLESTTGSIVGSAAIKASRNTSCLLSGDGGLIRLTAALVDLSSELQAFGGVTAAGGIVDVDSASVVRLGPVNVNGGEGDAGSLLVLAGGATTLNQVDARSVGATGIGGSILVLSTGALEVLGDIDALGGISGIAGDDGGDIVLEAGGPGSRADLTIVGNLEANARGPDGAGGLIDLVGDNVSLQGQLVATGGSGQFTTAGVIDIFADTSLTVSAPIDATQGGNGSVTLFSNGDLDVSALVDAGVDSVTAGGTVSMTAMQVLNVAADVRADGTTGGGSVSLTGCELNVPSGVSIVATGDGGSAEFVSGGLITVAGTVTVGPVLGSISLRHRKPAVPPQTAGALFSPAASITVDPLIPPCAICLTTTDTDADGVDDSCDRCTLVPDPSQADTDGDGFGNACDCDFDQSGQCGIADFNIFQADFSAAADGGTGTDMDANGVVGIGDFNLFLPGFSAAQPGPSALGP